MGSLKATPGEDREVQGCRPFPGVSMERVMKHRMKLLKAALAARRDAEGRIEAVLQLRFPIRCEIWWGAGGDDPQRGYVQRISGDRVQVMNARTRKVYWIYAERIVG